MSTLLDVEVWKHGSVGNWLFFLIHHLKLASKHILLFHQITFPILGWNQSSPTHLFVGPLPLQLRCERQGYPGGRPEEFDIRVPTLTLIDQLGSSTYRQPVSSFHRLLLPPTIRYHQEGNWGTGEIYFACHKEIGGFYHGSVEWKLSEKFIND